MALYVKGALGAFSGKVGNIVGANWRAIDYLRSRPRPSKKAATPEQIAQRAKFALVMEFLSPMRNFIKVSYNDKSHQNMTALNKVSNNLMMQVEGQYPDFTIPYDKVKFSKGSLSNINATIELNIGGNVELKWISSVNKVSANATDVVNIIMYSEKDEDFYVFQDAVREDGEYMFNPAGMTKDIFHVWIVLTSADGSNSSKCKYYDTLDLSEVED